MTDHIRALRVLCARTPSGDERDALEAAIKRCELPVIHSCYECHAYKIMKMGTHAECMIRKEYIGDPEDRLGPPPMWCPKRKQSDDL